MSESYLYKHPTLRDEIRAQAGKARPRTRSTGAASAASLRVKLEVTTSRVRELEDEVKRLRRENEAPRGGVIDLRRRARQPGRSIDSVVEAE